MANLKFYPDHLGDYTLVATSQATGFEVYHLQDHRLDTSWKATTTANQDVDIDLGASNIPITCVMLFHNLANGVNFQLWAATQSNYSDAAQVDSIAIDGTNTPYALKTWAAVTKRYWKFKMLNNTTVAQIYLAFLGRQLEITTRFNYGEIIEPVYDGVEVVESIGGYRGAREYHAGRDRWDYAYEFLSLANKQKLASVVAAVDGRRYPFFFSDDGGNFHFARLAFNRLEFAEVAHQLYNGPLIMEEEF